MKEEEIKELMERVKNQEQTIHIHTPYSESSGRSADFEVEYEFDIDPELGEIKPSQGMRSDFLYEGDDPKTDGIHMIWPEFLDNDGNIILDKRITPENSGTATMWILSPEAGEDVHRNRLKIGVKGRWVVGSKTLARVTVTKILGLYEND